MAIVMDGNGRWAAARGLLRSEGHRAGVDAVRRVVAAAPELGVGTLTLYALSSDNWRRPGPEIAALLGLFEEYLLHESQVCAENGVRIRVIGRRDRIPQSLASAIQFAEQATASARVIELRIAIDYSGRDAILRAACWMLSSLEVSEKEFARRLGQVTHAGRPSADVDLLIRTGGENRLSDFLLWECAYAEMLFTSRLWPDFGAEDLEVALQDFASRERRFGGLPVAAAGD
ncbi:MAG: polyprenyl diphosphate synthase [Candidatus Acidiferrales bacterium]